MSEPADQTEQAEESRLQRILGSNWLFVPIMVIALAAIVLYLIPVDEYVLLPGQAMSVQPMISIRGHPPKPHTGRLMLTDVSLYHATHKLEDLYFRLQSDADIEPAQVVSGSLSASQYNQLNISLMDTSIQSAEAAALFRVRGYHPHLAPTGPKIIFILPKTPASKVLRPGDVILAVDGKRVHEAAAVAPLVHRVKPGATLTLTILRGKKHMTVHVRTVHSTNGQRTRKGKTALIGIDAEDQLVFPVKIAINPGDIGGPSAGLMFTLGIIQRLSPTDITHGCPIAGTGEITITGAVGEIGGAKQKIIAARSAGARYFFVPDVPDNVKPAEQNRGNVTVVPVKTLDQALAYLAHLKPCR